MKIEELIQRINARKSIVENKFKMLFFPTGPIASFDAWTTKEAYNEIFLFEHYFLELNKLEPDEHPIKIEIQKVLTTLNTTFRDRDYNLASIQDIAILIEEHPKQVNYTLIDAAKNKDTELFEACVAAGADINFNYLGQTALLYAVKMRNHLLAQRAIELGAEVNVVTGMSVKTTPLTTAAGLNDLEMVKLLEAAGADINLQATSNGKTALSLATQKQHVEIHESGSEPKSPNIVNAYQTFQKSKSAQLPIETVTHKIENEVSRFRKNAKSRPSIGNNKKANRIERALERAQTQTNASVQEFLTRRVDGNESILDALSHHRKISFFRKANSRKEVELCLKEMSLTL